MTRPDTAATAVAEQKIPAPAAVLLGAPLVPRVRRPRSLLVYLSYGWLVLVIGLAVLANVLPVPSYTIPVGDPRQGPGGGLDLLLGTDSQGRPMIARAVYGAQVSLLVGTIGGLLGAVIGALLGLLAGYLGGWVDWIVRLVADALLAFPPLLLLLAISSILTPSITTLTAGLTLLIIPTFTRIARANTLAWASRDFITAARNMGASRRRILVREILPNLLPSLAAYLPIVISALIVAEGSLSFLGQGIPPPRPSWGGMISEGKDYLVDAPHMVLVPALIIFFTVFALNQVGDHLRQRFDRTLHD
ncbi:ABC transporter permease [Frankia sp. CNm7]|uniref:ABC transporter permease n=1 Tax=Frankia nepalensis TaxID=1836974 RepID=A0A937UPQ7_9ACTN|nr:ABC transporter permease [Frankia nepalensis]MBL7502487.1 ABC transporter permease [Frankia nepalensis]MBL7516479.1 ABC transporter permease [Frankia nepalensis]MBL7518107.1 ABC transporter permease [Frankia nepalensis]MBL7625831.1 ABC transporter permease [Frankia nepalensis]